MLHDSEFGEVNLDSGAYISGPTSVDEKTSDMNHLQLIEEDTYAIVSSRMTNSIIKMHPKSGKTMWTLGGDKGDFGLFGIDGTFYKSGHSYWRGQHNAQYGGDAEYWMFDNNYEHETQGSRLLIVSSDTETYNASVVFEYETGTYAGEYGDCDRMPTGNVLGCWWQSYERTPDRDYDAKVVELDRDSQEAAFEMTIYGADVCHGDDDTTCTVESSWQMYSVERFYTKPLLYNVTCDRASSSLSFTSFDTHVHSSTASATYMLYNAEGSEQDTGDFDFNAYWLATDVSVALSSVPKKGSVKVTNSKGTSVKESFSCA